MNDQQPIHHAPQSFGTIDEQGQVTGKIFFAGEDGKVYVGELSGHYLAPNVNNVKEVEQQ